MEINSKQLHKHAMPVVMLLVGLMIVATLAFGNTDSGVGRGLGTRVIHVKLSGSGLAKITLTAPKPPTTPNLNHVGQTAADNLSFK